MDATSCGADSDGVNDDVAAKSGDVQKCLRAGANLAVCADKEVAHGITKLTTEQPDGAAREYETLSVSYPQS